MFHPESIIHIATSLSSAAAGDYLCRRVWTALEKKKKKRKEKREEPWHSTWQFYSSIQFVWVTKQFVWA